MTPTPSSNEKNIVFFASGTGRSVDNFLACCRERKAKGLPYPKTTAVISNRREPGVKQICESHNIPFIFSGDLDISEQQFCETNNINLVVLAGYLKKFPFESTSELPVINIHPALLPKFGGKGMYGINVHKAVIAAGETESGATVHEVSFEYDKGPILCQEKINIPDNPKCSAEELAKLVFAVECRILPEAIFKVLGYE